MSAFIAYKQCGVVTSSAPFVIERRGTESFVTVALERACATLDASTLRVVMRSARVTRSAHSSAIARVFVRKQWYFVITGVGEILYASRTNAWRALVRGGARTRTTTTSGGRANCAFVFGFYFICARASGAVEVIDVDDDVMAMRQSRFEGDGVGRKESDDMEAEASASETMEATEARACDVPIAFVTTAIAHPDGYIDKLVFGAEDGRMVIVNVRVGKVVHEFASVGAPIRALANSPAPDVVAVGLTDGRTLLFDLARGKVLFTLAMDAANTPVSALAFRTDGVDDVLCVGDARGRVTVWDLEKRAVRTVIRDAHEGAISSLKFLDGQPVMLSSGEDNTLKQWIFDRDDGDARLLRFRAGHSKPPTNVMFYGTEGKKILAAGHDRTLRIFHPFADQQNHEFSQKNTSKRARKMGVAEEHIKLPSVTRIAWGELRENDWANVVTAHEGSNKAYTWRSSKSTIGEHVLQCPNDDGKCAVTSVCVSACGNFAFVGAANGAVHRFNLQSGAHRGAFERLVDAASAPKRKKTNGNEGYNFPGGKRSFWALANQTGGNAKETLKIPAHDGEITCVAADSANRHIVTTSVDGVIRVWKFATMKLDMEISVGCGTTCGYLHRDSTLFAVGCSDKIVRVFDVVTGKRARTFVPRGDIDQVGDVKSVEISIDGRWVFALDSDGSLRVYDIPAARLIQHLLLGDTKVTAMSFSPAQDFLVTTHENRLGLYLWINRVAFEGTKKVAYGRKISVGLPERQAPLNDNEEVPEGEDGQVNDLQEYIHPDDNAEDDEEYTMEELEEYFEKMSAGPRQIAPGMITLAGIPQEQIETLLNLETVREKLKPKEAKKAPEQAPFFLPTAVAEDDVRRSIFDPIRESEVNKPSTPALDAEEPRSRILRPGEALAGANHDPLFRLILRGENSRDYTEALEFLKAASVNVVDAELRSLGPWDHNFMSADDEAKLKSAIAFFAAALESGMYYEMVNAHLSIFLTAHSTAIMSSPALKKACVPLQLAMHSSWSRLDDLFNEVRCALAFYTGQKGV